MSSDGLGATGNLKRVALIVAGSVSLGLGVVGVFVPLLPTTPFLLLAAACYLRSSPRLHERLMASRVLGRYIRLYQSGAGVPVRVKASAVGLLWLTIGCSGVFFVQSTVARVVLGLIAVAVTAHIISIRPPKR
jgi:uncharacterized protein